jgi:predicted DsbA family dithiol-disulfide isomerase
MFDAANAVGPGVDIDVYSDVVCPWCYIGKRRLDLALDGFEGEVNVRYRPFQLDPTTPHEPRPLLAWLGPKFGGEARAAAMTQHTTKVAAESGISLDFGKAIINNTFDAHRLIWFATSRGVGAEVAEALHRAHFTDGLDIGSPSVLAAVAASVGLNATDFLASDEGVAEVRAEIADAYALGIQSVPTFVFAGKYAVSGAQDPATLRATLEEVARREGAVSVLEPIGANGPACDDDSCAV